MIIMNTLGILKKKSDYEKEIDNKISETMGEIINGDTNALVYLSNLGTTFDTGIYNLSTFINNIDLVLNPNTPNVIYLNHTETNSDKLTPLTKLSDYENRTSEDMRIDHSVYHFPFFQNVVTESSLLLLY